MLSLSKLLVLAAIIAAVWFGFRIYTRMQAERARVDRAKGQAGRAEGPRGARSIPAEDMLQCSVCGVYVGAGAARCGRAGCPQG